MVMAGARRSGLDCPPAPLQLASWLLFGLFVAPFYALELLYTDLVGRAVAGALYGALALSAFVAGAFATATDPADAGIYVGEPQHAPREQVADHLYCYRCERHVKDTSKHCTMCLKCVDVFDHHCVWLNNCVGAHNYRAFLALLVAAAGQLLLQMGYGIYVIVRFGQGPDEFDARVREFYPNLSGGAFLGITVATTFLAIIALVLVLQLLGFHAYLISHQLTTYDFIVNRSHGGSAKRAASSSQAGRHGHGHGHGHSHGRHGDHAEGEEAAEEPAEGDDEAGAGDGAAAAAAPEAAVGDGGQVGEEAEGGASSPAAAAGETGEGGAAAAAGDAPAATAAAVAAESVDVEAGDAVHKASGAAGGDDEDAAVTVRMEQRDASPAALPAAAAAATAAGAAAGGGASSVPLAQAASLLNVEV